MYNLKKVIASICVIAMMLTTVAFAATYSDVAEDSAYYEAIETLNKLGIVTGYEDGTYKPEAGVTRAEMAALIARIQGYGESAAGQTATSFVDVPASHWASGYVASAASTGIINGYGDGNFGPDDSVLFEQAVKMIMAALGYTPYAEYNGGYPGGYLAAAQRYNVTANVSNATMGTEANRGTIAQLLANAIDTPLMQQVGWTTNGEVDYVICDGKNGNDYKTLMSEYLNVVKIRGVVTENAYTNIYNEKTIDTEDDEVVVIDIVDTYDTTNKDFKMNDDVYVGNVDTFLVGESDAADYLGKSVIAYVQEVDDEYAIVSIVEDTTRNDILTIDLSQFNKINANGKFEYFKTTAAKTATAVALDDKVDVVYNNVGGFELKNVVEKDEDGEEVIVEYGIFGSEEGSNIVLNEGATLDGGMITLIDNDDEKGYDVIFVEVAKTAVVDESEENYVAFKNSVYELDELEIDEDDTDRVVKVTKDGAEIALADLVEWDVLSVITVEGNDDYILAEVVSTQVVGTVTSESKSTTSAEGKAYKIGSDKYDVAEGAYGMPVNVGDGGTFYIDKYGKIAAFNEDAALASGIAANYAYVTAVAFDEDILTGKATAIVQMVTADGVVALNIKSTGAKLDGDPIPTITITKDEDGKEVVTGGDDIDELVGQMIKYSKNSANNITNISTFDYEKEDDKMSGGMYAEVASAEYDADDNRFVGEFFMDANSYVFFIDEEEAEDSFLGTEADLADGEDYDIMGVYADKKADDNNIVIVKYEGGKAGRKAGLAVITSVGTSENEDGEAIYAIEALVNGEELAADTTADVETVVTPGDIVKIKVDGNGLIAAIDMVVDFDVDDNNNIVKAATTGLLAYAPEFDFDGIENGDEKIYGGKVLNYRKSSNTATLKIGTAVDEDGEEYDLTDEFKLSQAENIIVIDDNGRLLEVKKGSASSFKFYEDLYDAEVESVKVTVAGATKASAATKADAQNVADFVFVREYDGRVADVVIVKGPADTKVKAN